MSEMPYIKIFSGTANKIIVPVLRPKDIQPQALQQRNLFRCGLYRKSKIRNYALGRTKMVSSTASLMAKLLNVRSRKVVLPWMTFSAPGS